MLKCVAIQITSAKRTKNVMCTMLGVFFGCNQFTPVSYFNSTTDYIKSETPLCAPFLGIMKPSLSRITMTKKPIHKNLSLFGEL